MIVSFPEDEVPRCVKVEEEELHRVSEDEDVTYDEEPFPWLSDDLRLQVLIRTRWASHGAVAATCRTFQKLMRSKRFSSARRAAGYEERALFVWERHLFRPRFLANDGSCWRCPRLPVDGAVCAVPSATKGELVAICRPPRPTVCDDEFATVLFDVRRKRWRIIEAAHSNPPVEKTVGSSYLAVANVGKEIYAVTTNYRQRISTFRQGQWTQLNIEMPDPVVEAAFVGVGTTLLVIGGRRAKFARGELPTEALDSVQALDTTTHRWRNLAPLPEPRTRAVACEHQGKVFLIGGLNHGAGTSSTTTFVLDTLDDTWRQLPAELPPRGGGGGGSLAAAVVHAGSRGTDHILLYSGGDDGSNGTESHQDLLGRHRIEPPLLLPLSDDVPNQQPTEKTWISFDDDLADVLLGTQSVLVKNHMDLVHESSHIDNDVGQAPDDYDHEPPAPRTPYVHPCVASIVLG